MNVERFNSNAFARRPLLPIVLPLKNALTAN